MTDWFEVPTQFKTCPGQISVDASAAVSGRRHSDSHQQLRGAKGAPAVPETESEAQKECKELQRRMVGSINDKKEYSTQPKDMSGDEDFRPQPGAVVPSARLYISRFWGTYRETRHHLGPGVLPPPRSTSPGLGPRFMEVARQFAAWH